jgi:hypothetical protein
MFPGHWTFEKIVVHALSEGLVNQQIIRENQGEIMAKLSDVQAAVAKLKADVQAFIAANSGGASATDLDGLVADINVVDALVSEPPVAS